jgi:hypothetical protein
MNCPHCNAYNEAGSQFCINCGQSLAGNVVVAGGGAVAPSAEETSRQLLGIHTLRLLFGLLVLFVFYKVLINLSFVERLIIPDFPFTATEIIRALVYLVALVLLLGYAQSLRNLWPKAYPRWSAITPLLVALIYVAVIAAAYSAIATPLLVLTEEPDAVLVLQIVLLVLAVLVLGSAWVSFYTGMPSWLRNLRLNVPVSTTHDVACLNCGYLNPDTNQFCGHCGHEMKSSPPLAEEG